MDKEEQHQETTATANKRKRHRPYVKNACLHCNSSHLSCSNERPCARCVSRGIECVEKPVKSRKIGPQLGTTNFNIASQIIINANANPALAPLQQLRPSPSTTPAPLSRLVPPNFQQLQKLHQPQQPTATTISEIQDESLRVRLLQIIASQAPQLQASPAAHAPAVTTTNASHRPLLPITAMPTSSLPTTMPVSHPFVVNAQSSLPTLGSSMQQSFVPPASMYTPAFHQPLASAPPPVAVQSAYMNPFSSSTPAHSAPSVQNYATNNNNNNALVSQLQTLHNVLQAYSAASSKLPQQNYSQQSIATESTTNNHSLLPLIPLNLEEEDPKPAATEPANTTQQDQDENVVVNLPSFCVRLLDMAHSEMTAWHRKNFKLLHANSTFLSHYKLSRESIGSFTFFDFDPRGLNPKPPHLRALFFTILQPHEFGKEPFVKKYWHKFFIDDGETRKMITINVTVEKDFFFFERSKVLVGKSCGASEDMKDAYIEEFQVNDLEVQTTPPTSDRVSKVMKIASFIDTQRSIAMAQHSHQFV